MTQFAKKYPGLLVPVGVDATGTTVPVDEADKTASYWCPGCTGPLVLRTGPMVRKHFAHAHLADEEACNKETLLHKTAKALIVQAVNAHMRGDVELQMECVCKSCGQVVMQRLPRTTFCGAEMEVLVGEFRADVVATRVNGAALVIEIRATHAVPEHKARGLDVPWIELDAKSVVENPRSWAPLASGHIKTVTCHECKAVAKKLFDVAHACGVDLPMGADSGNPEMPYLAAVIECWKCHEDTIVFRWADAPFAETPPPHPIPKVLACRFSKTYGGKYWMNCCGRCGAPQGDNFLYIFPEGPFFRMPRRALEQEVQARKNHTNAIIDRMLRNF